MIVMAAAVASGIASLVGTSKVEALSGEPDYYSPVGPDIHPASKRPKYVEKANVSEASVIHTRTEKNPTYVEPDNSGRFLGNLESLARGVKVKEVGPDNVKGPSGTRSLYIHPDNNDIMAIGTLSDRVRAKIGEYEAMTSEGSFITSDGGKSWTEIPVPDNFFGKSHWEVPRDVVTLDNENFLLVSDHVVTNVNIKDPQKPVCVNIFDHSLTPHVKNSFRDSSGVHGDHIASDFDIQTAIVAGGKLLLGGRDITQGLRVANLAQVRQVIKNGTNASSKEPDWNWVGSLFGKVEPANGLIIRALVNLPGTQNTLLTAYDGRFGFYDTDNSGYFKYTQRSGTGVVMLDRNLELIKDHPYNKNVDDDGKNIPISVIYPYDGGLILGNERPAKANGVRTNKGLVQIYDKAGNLLPEDVVNSPKLIEAGGGDAVSINGVVAVKDKMFVAINGGNLVSANLGDAKKGLPLNWTREVTQGEDGYPLGALGMKPIIDKVTGEFKLLIGRYPNGDQFRKPVVVSNLL